MLFIAKPLAPIRKIIQLSKKALIISGVILGLICTGLYSQTTKMTFYGYNLPNDSTEIFAPDIISTEYNEFTPTLSSDGDVLYFSRKTDYFKIYVTTFKSKQWIKPEIAIFSGKYDDVDCVFSPDGTKLFFASKRPVIGDSIRNDYDFWKTESISGDWSLPKHEGEIVNSKYNDLFSSISQNGTKYFDFKGDIYKSVMINGEYSEKEKLGEAINSKYLDKEPFIAPNESYLIFVSDRPDENFGDVDLYISFRKNDNTWSKPMNMGKSINSVSTDQAPVVTLNGNILFFSSRRKIDTNINENKYGNGSSDIYWIDAEIIDRLKEKNAALQKK